MGRLLSRRVSRHAAGGKLSLHEIKWRVPVSFDKITDDPKLSYFLISSVTTRQQPLDPFGERNFFQGVIHWVSPAPSNTCQTVRSPYLFDRLHVIDGLLWGVRYGCGGCQFLPTAERLPLRWPHGTRRPGPENCPADLAKVSRSIPVRRPSPGSI